MSDALTRMLDTLTANPLKTVTEFADFGHCDDPECKQCRILVANRCLHVAAEDALVRMVEAEQQLYKDACAAGDARRMAGHEILQWRWNAIAAEVMDNTKENSDEETNS